MTKLKTINEIKKEIENDIQLSNGFWDKYNKEIEELKDNNVNIIKSKKIKLNLVSSEIYPKINLIQEKIIGEVWDKELKSKKLFNGKIISYLSHKEIEGVLNIECFVTEYKYFLAQLKGKLNLNIIPIGVSGIIIDDKNNTLVGIRRNVTEYEGFYELMPSGGLTNDDFVGQLIKEFEEETKLKKSLIKNIEPFCLAFDEKHKVYDICCKIYLNTNLKQSLSTEEYNKTNIINLKDINNKLNEKNCVPTSLMILKCLEEK